MKKEIESRLIQLALSIDKLCISLVKNCLSKHLISQIMRSSTSAALNYAEAQSAESKKDFIHKTTLVLKELRETKVCLELMTNVVPESKEEAYTSCYFECDQLIAIMYRTIESTRKNMIRRKEQNKKY